jgi:hypothetical protein
MRSHNHELCIIHIVAIVTSVSVFILGLFIGHISNTDLFYWRASHCEVIQKSTIDDPRIIYRCVERTDK